MNSDARISGSLTLNGPFRLIAVSAQGIEDPNGAPEVNPT